VLQRLGEELRVTVVAERFDGVWWGFEDLRHHVGPAAAGIERAREHDQSVVGWPHVVVPESVLDRSERVLHRCPSVLRFDVRSFGVFLGDVGDDVADQLVFGDVDRDELGARTLVPFEFLYDLPELVFLLVRLLLFLLLAHYSMLAKVA